MKDAIFVIGNVPDSDEESEMSELRKRMNDAMVLRGLAKHHGRSPETLGSEVIQEYLALLSLLPRLRPWINAIRW